MTYIFFIIQRLRQLSTPLQSVNQRKNCDVVSRMALRARGVALGNKQIVDNVDGIVTGSTENS